MFCCWKVKSFMNISEYCLISKLAGTSREFCWWWSLRLLVFNAGSKRVGILHDAVVLDGFWWWWSLLLCWVILGIMSLSLSLWSSSSATSERGLWVVGSIPLCLSFFLREEFQKFFISLSVLPGNWAAIWDHLDYIGTHNELYMHKLDLVCPQIRILRKPPPQKKEEKGNLPWNDNMYLLPRTAWSSMMWFSSCWENAPLFKSGLK